VEVESLTQNFRVPHIILQILDLSGYRMIWGFLLFFNSSESCQVSNQIVKVFENNGNKIRTIVIEGEVWFVGNDVANALGYVNSRDALMNYCEGVAKRDIPTSSGVQNMNTIPESDMYSLVFGSKLPTAKDFKRWVTSEVLPTIRKTGSYGVASLPDFNNPIAAAEAWIESKKSEMAQKAIADEAVRTKAEIGSRREATAMNTASVAMKQLKKMEIALDKSQEYSTIKRMEMILKKKFDWRQLTSSSRELGLQVNKVPDVNYGSVNSYHREAWLHAFQVSI
jgi:prophage antirepressor-like protein